MKASKRGLKRKTPIGTIFAFFFLRGIEFPQETSVKPVAKAKHAFDIYV